METGIQFRKRLGINYNTSACEKQYQQWRNSVEMDYLANAPQPTKHGTIKALYRNGLTAKAIAKKYNMKLEVVIEILERD